MNRKPSFLAGLVAVAALALPGQAAMAAFSQGTAPCDDPVGGPLTCLQPGNDTTANVFGLPISIIPENATGDPDLFLLAKSDDADDGIGIGTLTVNQDTNNRSGTWTYSGPELVAYLTVKAGPDYEIWGVQNLGNMGCWATNIQSSALCNNMDLISALMAGGSSMGPALSHLSIWGLESGDTPQLIPIPAAGWLFLSAIAGLVVVGRRRRLVDGAAAT